MKKTIKMVLVLGITALLISLIGCSSEKQVNAPIEQPEIQYIEDSESEETFFKQNYSNIYPLTGIGTNEQINQRIFAVMVNNHSTARPQSGLHKADIVFEILSEWEITRYLALYQSELPDVVGPVRSARDYFIHLSNGYGSIYVAYGGSPEAFLLLRDMEMMDYIGGILRTGYADDEFFYRVNFRKAPHNVYTTKEELIRGADRRNYSLTQNVEPYLFMTENEIPKISGKPAKDIMINYGPYYNTSFKFDEKSKKYQRFTNDEQSKDRETDTPIEVNNVLIIEAPHKVIDNEGRRDIQLDGSGRGYIIQHGIVRDIIWENNDGRIIPYINGEVVALSPGKTWINVIPDSPGLEKMISFGIENEE
ncbi:DUF3048 domain-containing protein [Calidifontibacillus oryziterrae]|uniref:DUF3048 domain-containing protein n=1 Tax=Calidifontibacillus oryziterrae TaxID=1191699 RepID=UPI0003121102|nr:DUF3048 domain-containing protein [Calidifontibacillus oryziterrae]